jgi:hypothetical protein
MSLRQHIQKPAKPKSVELSEHAKPKANQSAGAKQLTSAGAEAAMSPAHIMQLQRTIGNQAVQRMIANQNAPMQRAEPEEELQMKADPNAIQRAAPEEEELQMKADPNKMPKNVQSKMEGAFNSDFSNVKIHQGSKASEVGALAYAQGNDIHFAPGQYDPGSKSGQELLGHELTHVVQQRQGEVKPTTQVNGLAVNDDPGLENEADQMGKRAAEQPELNI